MQTLRRRHKSPALPLPAGAADCHMHVFGPYARFPLAAERAYNVPEAPLEAHERMKRAVGLERTVLVQASGYGEDNRALLAALAALGPRARAVAVVSPDADPRELERLHAVGVRGLRLNLYTLAGRYPEAPEALVARFARAIAPLGWHLQLLVDAPALAVLAPALGRAPLDVVVDHMGLPDARAGLAQPGFQALLGLVRTGRVWTKLSGADRVTRHTGDLRDALPYMRSLAQAAPERLVWGSDWPNIGFHARAQVADAQVLEHRELDAGTLLDLLGEALPDAALRRKVLVANPEQLYGFARG